MITVTPEARLAGLLCDLAARTLPEDVGQRYAEEWRADLAADPTYALQYASSILANVLVLRLTLSGAVKADQPLRCQLHLHHYVPIHDNPENRRATSHRCTRCGHITDDSGVGGWPGRFNVSDRDPYAR